MSSEESPAAAIVDCLKRAGITLVASLPDQWLGELIETCEADPAITHVKLSREDDGVGLCMGAYLGGRRAALICQNSGVLLSANVLSAVAYHHQVPLLVLAAYRGCFDDGHYYQMYKGRVTEGMLKGLGLPYYVMEGPEQISLIEQGAKQSLLSRLPLVLLMRKRALVGTPGGRQ